MGGLIIRSLLKRVPAALARRLSHGGPHPAILLYHRIAEEPFDPWGLAVTPERFRQHVRWLSASGRVIPLGEFAAKHRDRTLPADAIAVTFDDGYACLAKTAAPLLEEAGVPATIFIPAEVIERREAFWWDELEQIIFEFSGDSIELDDAVIELGQRTGEDRSWSPGAKPATPRQHAFLRLWDMIRQMDPQMLERSMDELRDQSELLSPPGLKRPMSPEEVRSISSDKIQFGSHALTHPCLPLLSRAQKATEISDSLDRCEALAGRRPVAFAYPYGEFDEDSEELVSRAGFLCACTIEHKAATTESDMFALPRLTVGNCGAATLGRAIRYAPE